MSESLLHAEDVAAMLAMSTDWVYAEVRAGRIPHVKLGRYVRFRAETIDEWIIGLERPAIPSRETTKRPGDRANGPGAWHRRESSHAGQP
jgi:excisionase family DNA binding protein